ncbi:MAG: hypothetical protein RL331_379 [Bacteroidota bacterium]|jgi:hypothetical protein
MIKKKGSIAVVFFIVVICCGYIFGLLPIVIGSANDYAVNPEVAEGGEFNPLNGIDISKNCEIYLWMSLDDQYAKNRLLNGKVFVCDDVEVLKSIKDNFNFISDGSDLATVNSRMYIYQNDKLIFSSSVVIEQGLFGLQSSQFGWVKNNKLLPLIKKFRRVHTPVVFL